MEPAVFAGLKRATLTQLNPAAAGCRTLFVNGKSGFLIEDVNVDMGGDHLSGNMVDNAGIYINNCNRFHLSRVEAYNGGPTTAIGIHNSNTFDLTDITARDMVYDVSLAPTNDTIQGIVIDACITWTALRLSASNLTASAPVLNPGSGTSSIYWYSRGITVTGSSSGVMDAPAVEYVDQGIDFTGTLGNHDITVNDPVVRHTGTHGFKGANSAHGVTVNRGLVEYSGLDSYTIQGMTEPANPNVEDNTFNDCISRWCGSNGLWPLSARWHYSIIQTGDPNFPRRTAFNRCTAEDNPLSRTSTGGFKNEAVAGAGNTLTNCSAPGCAIFEEGF